MNFIYKKIPPEQSLQYRTMRLESLKRHPSAFSANFIEESKLAELMFEASIKTSDKSNFVIGAFINDNLVGICGFVSRNQYALKHTGTIIQMYVQEKYRGNDLGLQLTNKVVEDALKLSQINNILLEVKKTNTPAIAVYDRAGFSNESISNDPELIYMLLRNKV